MTEKAVSTFRVKRENNKVKMSKCTEKTQSACFTKLCTINEKYFARVKSNNQYQPKLNRVIKQIWGATRYFQRPTKTFKQ